jgi:hypothetical protein
MRRGIVALALAALCGCDGKEVVKLTEAESAPWFKIEHETRVSDTRLVVGCDLRTGDRLYILGPGADGKAMVVIPGGCK